MSIRTIVMGLGGRGRGWARDVMRSQAVEFAGMVDPNPERLNLAGEQLGVVAEKRFARFEEACDKARPEAVVIVTPNVMHEEHIRACLDRGLHVLGEKPLVMSPEGGRAIVEEAERKRLVVMAVQNYRYAASTMEMRRLVAAGDVGEPTSALVHFSRLRPIRGMAYALLYNQGIHHLDTMRHVFGCNAKSVYARSWNPKYHDCDADTSCEAIFEMDSGVVINYSASYSTRGPNTSYGGVWRIECSGGTIHLNPTGDDEKLWISRNKGKPEEAAAPPPPLDPNAQLLADLAGAIRDGVPPPTNARDNMHSLAMIWAIIESAATGRVAAVRGDL